MKAREYPQREFLHECFEFREVEDEHSQNASPYRGPNIHSIWRERPISHFKNIDAAKKWNAKNVGTRAGTDHESRPERKDRIIKIEKANWRECRIIYIALVDPSFYIASDNEIDHVGQDSLYNAIENLRVANSTEQTWNKQIVPNRDSGFISVRKFGRNKQWGVRATDNDDNRKFLGLYPDASVAAHVYDDFIRPIRGDRGFYNFPKDGERGLPQLLLAA